MHRRCCPIHHEWRGLDQPAHRLALALALNEQRRATTLAGGDFFEEMDTFRPSYRTILVSPCPSDLLVLVYDQLLSIPIHIRSIADSSHEAII